MSQRRTVALLALLATAPLTALDTPTNGHLFIETLSEKSILHPLYQLDAGVSEGYTIGEHTARVLDEFDQDYVGPEIDSLLESCGSSRERFRLFLSLHDIGKGRAVLEEGGPSAKRKEKELRYCCEVIEELCDEIDRPFFKALLNDDNIGSLLKHPFLSAGYLVGVARELEEAAESCGVDPLSFAQAKILFHQIDASTYPGVRRTVFELDEERKVNLDGEELEGVVGYRSGYQWRVDELLTLLAERHPEADIGEYRDLIAASAPTGRFASLSLPEVLAISDLDTLTYEDVEALHRIRSALKAQEGKTPLYHRFSHFLKRVRTHKMPWRVAAFVKSLPHLDTHITWNGDLACLKEALEDYPEDWKEVRALLIDAAKEQEHKLSILERVTLLHGTNSATLTMMALRDQWRLVHTGALMAEGVAPMCGELGAGVGITGVNKTSISAETVRDLKRVQHYASNFNAFDLDKLIDRFEGEYASVKKQANPEGLMTFGLRITQLRQWDEELFQEMMKKHHVFSSVLEVRDLWVQRLETCLRLLDAELTEEESGWLLKDCEGPLPASFARLVPDEAERREIFGEELYPTDTTSISPNGVRMNLGYAFAGSWSWGPVPKTILMMRAGDPSAQRYVEGVPELKELLQERIGFLYNWYEQFFAFVDREEPIFSVPHDEEIRSRITDPFPVVLGSTRYKPESMINRDEYLVYEELPFGEGGIDMIVTDTEEHRQVIVEMLPEAIREKIEVWLYEDLDVGDFPCFHGLHQIR